MLHSRRDVLRLAGAAGVAAVAPGLLTGCGPTVPIGDVPGFDPSLAGLGFAGGVDQQVGPGGWCWFQMPRASLDVGGRLWTGSQVANTFTPGDGEIHVTAWDTVQNRLAERLVVAKSAQDDHVSPSVLVIGDRVQVAWALHRKVDYLHTGIHTPGQKFTPQKITRPGALTIEPKRGMSYASVHRVGRGLWLLYRGEHFSWNLLTSPDGVAWTARGLVVAPPSTGHRPYLHAASTGTALTITVTDANPTEYPGTGVYVGTVGQDMRITDAAGTVRGTVGAAAPKPSQLTRLLAGSAGAPGEADDTDGWLCDLRHVSGQPTGILSVRDPWPDGSASVGAYRHRYVWIRRRSTGWVVEHLAWAGSEIVASAPDYAGLGAVDPTNAARVVISTNVDPASGLPLPAAVGTRPRFELFEGNRVGEGLWQWTPLTTGSAQDNLRPTIAAAGTHKALAWMRGTYWGWNNVATDLVVRPAAVTP